MTGNNPLTKEEQPGPALAATLGLIALGFLPLADGGYSGTGYQIGFVLLPVAAAIGWGVSRRRPLQAVVVMLMFLLSGLLGFHWIQQGRLLWYYMLHIPAAWICTWVLFTEVEQRARYFFAVISISACTACLWGWYLWLGSGKLGYQINSTFGLHNAFAGYLLLAWPAAALGYIRAETARARLLYGIAVVFICATLLLTYSRASWVVFVLQLLIVFGVVLAGRLKGKSIERRIGLLGLSFAVLLGATLALEPVRQAVASIGNFDGYSMQGRFRFWTAALEIFRDHPWTGVGLGNFAYVYPQYQKDYIYYSVDPHSWPLQLLCELGLPGLIISILIVTGIVLWIRRLWKTEPLGLEPAILTAAVCGSMLHAAVDFDYTFGATTALLGALLAYGTFKSTGGEDNAPQLQSVAYRLLSGVTVLLLLVAGLFGEALTAERFNLDRLRAAPELPREVQTKLLSDCIRYNPLNHSTRYQLASVIAYTGSLDVEGNAQVQRLSVQDREAAMEQLDRSLELNPLFPRALALKGLLTRPPSEGEKLIAEALRLDPYNIPEHYFYYASLAEDDDTKRKRLLQGMEAIPVNDPIRPDHVRPTWYELNPLFRDWWHILSNLARNEDERDLYLKRYVRFKVYCEEQLETDNSDLIEL